MAVRRRRVWLGLLLVLPLLIATGSQIPLAPADAAGPSPAPPSWRTLASLPEVASNVGATWDGAHTIYLMNGANSQLRRTLVFSTVSRTWSEATPMSPANASSEAVLGRDGRIYVLGGATAAGGANAFSVFDPTSGVWTRAAPLPGPRSNSSITAATDGRIFVFGGEDASGQPLLDGWVYSPSTNQWTQLPDVPRPAFCGGDCLDRFDRSHAIAAPDGKVYLIGHGWLPMDVFNPATGRWSTAPALPATGMVDFGVTVDPVSGRVVVAGGLQGVDETSRVWYFDPSTQAWSAGPAMPGMAGAVSLISDRSFVYAVGGFGQLPSSGNVALATSARVAALGAWNGANTSVALGKSAASRLGRAWQITEGAGGGTRLVDGILVGGDDHEILGTRVDTGAGAYRIPGYHYFQDLGSLGHSALVLATWPLSDGTYAEGVVSVTAATGVVNWRLPIPGPFCCFEENDASAYPVIGRDLYLFNSGVLYAVDASTGALAWSTPVDAPYGVGPLTADANGVYLSHGEQGVGHLVALDPATGAVRWTRTWQLDQGTPDGGSAQQLFADGTRIYAELSTTEVVAFGDAAGSVAWRVPNPTGPDPNWCAGIGTQLAVSNGGVVVSGPGIYALDPATGAPLWHYSVACAETSAPAIDRGVVYTVVQRAAVGGFDFRSAPATLTELDLASGKVLAEQPNDGNPGGMPEPVVVAGDVVFAGGVYTAAQVGATPTAPTAIEMSTFAAPAGTKVVISGLGLSQVQGILVGGLPLRAPVTASPLSVSFTVPASMQAGLLTLVAPTGSTLGPMPWWSLPKITAVTPGWAPVGSQVTITGTNLGDVTGVDFGGNAAGVVSQSDTSITVTVPPGADGTYLTVTAGPASATAAVPFSPPTPTITSINPSSGPVGTAITINGTDLTNVSYVQFTGKVFSTATINPDGSLSTTVPAGALTGTVYVCFTTGVGCIASPQPFTVN